MGKVLFLEPVGGIAGDMFLALGISLGLSAEEIAARLAGLNVPGWRFAVSRAERHAISGTHLDVVVDEVPHAHAHRALADIEALIDAASTLSDGMKRTARRIFAIIGAAEAKIHGVPIGEIHFHEVGAVDSIIDICGAAVVLELLGNPEVYSLPPPLGSGTIKSAHGNLPIPPPATLEILRDVPVRFEGVGELVTPTGAGILKAIAKVEAPPPLVIERVGYGVGTKDFPDRPNVLRGSLGVRASAAGSATDTLVLEANLDDATPQLIAHVLERLMTEGALDVWVSPVTMKKGRPGHLLGALVTEATRAKLTQLILEESTTLGVRWYPAQRTVLTRRFVTVETKYGKVEMKLGELDGKVVNAQPEFDDCRERAREHGVPLKQVLAAALAAWGTGSAGSLAVPVPGDVKGTKS